LNHIIRVDNKTTSIVNAGIFVVDSVKSVDLADAARWIGPLGKRQAAWNHLGQFSRVPNLVAEATVLTERDDPNTQLFDLLVASRHGRQFGRANEREVVWVKTHRDPLALVVRQFDWPESSVNEGVGFEVGCWFANTRRGSGRSACCSAVAVRAAVRAVVVVSVCPVAMGPPAGAMHKSTDLDFESAAVFAAVDWAVTIVAERVLHSRARAAHEVSLFIVDSF